MFSFATQELLILYSTPVYFFIILFEIIAGNLQNRHWYSLKDTLHNLYLMLINTGFDVMVRVGYILVLAFFWNHKGFEVEKDWIYWALLVLAIDFMFYWMHRLEHSVRLFWAVHVTHHSSEKFNFTVGFRSSVFQPFYRFVFFIPVVLLGFHPVDIVFINSACQIWGILVHTEMVKKLGWLEYVLVTPSHHRVHHASNPLYLDKNLGMFLILWDKMFGTFQPELTEKEYQPIRYGLTSPKILSAPLSIVLHEWNDMLIDLKREISIVEKLNYVFGPPGWSHDGSRLTSQEMREMENKNDSPLFQAQVSAIQVDESSAHK